MIVQISANSEVIGAVEVYENNENGEITVINKTETLSIGELDNMQVINGLLHSNDNVLDIDLDDDGVFFTPEEFKALMSCKSSWVEFETNRNQFELGGHDDWQATLQIIAPLKIYHVIDEEEYTNIKNQVNKFFEYDGTHVNNNSYEYEELDEFIDELHPLLSKC